MSRYDNFTVGVLDFSAILYYLSITGVFLLLTVRVYDKRRWG
jgi:ABC-2 type transport system permease protein